MGLAEATLFRRPVVPSPARLPASVRAELDADEALEADDDDVAPEAKREGDEYI
jgi:hypothetical protein